MKGRVAYVTSMMDVMAALKDRKAKAEGRVARATKALESYKKELADVIAAERVMAEITGESVETKGPTAATSDRDRDIAKLLGTHSDDAKSPAELYPMYVSAHGTDLNLDSFRTALWRLQKKVVQGEEKNWAVRADGGRYWRIAVRDEFTDFDDILGGDEELP
jgi:hypothetical protein